MEIRTLKTCSSICMYRPVRSAVMPPDAPLILYFQCQFRSLQRNTRFLLVHQSSARVFSTREMPFPKGRVLPHRVIDYMPLIRTMGLGAQSMDLTWLHP